MDKAVQWGIACGCAVTGVALSIFLVVCSRSYKRRKKLLSATINTRTSQDNSTQPNTSSFGNLQYRGPSSRNSNPSKSQQNRLGPRNMMDRRSEKQRLRQTDIIKSIVEVKHQTGKSGNTESNLRDKVTRSFLITETETDTQRESALFSRSVLFRDSPSLITRSQQGNGERSSFYSLQDFPMDRIRIPRAHLASSSIKENSV